jgi:hypothetical protein
MYIYRQLFPNVDKYQDIGNGWLYMYIIFNVYFSYIAKTQYFVVDPDF